MSQNRVELGTKLKTVLGNNNTYFQPPENLVMKYPCARYKLDGYRQRHANNDVYMYEKRYVITFITTDPDNDYYDSMMRTFTYCRFDRSYVSGNLYHYVFTVYY